MELQENQLRELASDSFSSVPNLLMLNLSYNQLTGLDRAGLHGLKSLEVLDLSHNKISNFDYHNFPPLDSLVQLRVCVRIYFFNNYLFALLKNLISLTKQYCD